MKPKTTILMVLAITCGLAAAFMTNKLIAERGKPAEEVKIVKVLVAKKKIEAMTFVKKDKFDEFFEVQDKPENEAKNRIENFEDKDVKDGFRVARIMPIGAPLSRDDLFSRDLEGLASRVPPGMRATAVRVTAESLAGGFVLPNSKVDIVWCFRSTTNEVGSLTILQDVLVLAVDTQSTRNPENPQTILGATVTLALKPEDVMKIRLASQNGDLALSLRKAGDEKKEMLQIVKPSDLTRLTPDTEDKKEGEDKEGTPPVVTVPPLPALPASGTGDPTTPAPAVVEEPAKPKKIHRLVIEDGPNVQVHQFPFNEETGTFDGGIVTRSDVEKPAAKAEPKKDEKKDDKTPESDKKAPKSYRK